MRLSNSQIEILRQQPQSTELQLSIFEPQIIFQAQINDVDATRGLRVVAYDNVSLGHYTAIEPNFTAWIGITLGGKELGTIRVRSATSSEITVSENSNINWQNDAYITIFRYVELWPVYPRIIQDPSDPEDTIWYKDYDIPYTNQNSILGTFVNMGPHRAAYRDPASGLVQIYYSSTGTYNLLGDTLNYQWFFEGATVTGSSSANPGWITYDHSGFFTTRLIVSGSSGAIDTSYRYIAIDPPKYKWQLMNMNGSRGEGGHSISVKIFSIMPLQEHAVVVLHRKSFYGNSQDNLGGNFPNAGNIFFVGYIDKDTISYDYEHSEITFDALSLTGLMKDSSGFSVSVQSVANPQYWYELLDMDGRRALYHYLRWHTTALQIGDFQFVGSDYKIQFFDADRESMYDAINNYMRDTLIGQVVSDRQSKTWLEVEAKAYSNPTGSFPAYMDITKRDWMNTPTITERLSPEVSFMEYGGVAYSGVVTGTFEAIIGAAPGTTPDFHGNVENHQGLALAGQTQLNQLVGNVFANANSQFPEVGMDLSISATNLDIAPQETLQLNINSDDTIRNLNIRSLYIPESISWRYSPDTFSLFPQIDFQQLVNGETGEAVVIITDPANTELGGGFNVPGLQIPPLPTLANPTQDCCQAINQLGLNLGTQCCLVTRSYWERLPPGPVLHVIEPWDYTNNTIMYNINTDPASVLALSGSGTYSVHLEFDYLDYSVPNPPNFIYGHMIRVDANADADGFVVKFETPITEGPTGHASLTGTAQMPDGLGSTGWNVVIFKSAGTPAPGHPTLILSNVRLTICRISS